MPRRTTTIMFCAALAFQVLVGRAAPAATDEFGQTLYRSQQGASDGYPGCFPDTVEKVDKEGNKQIVAKYPRWGHPELENYPGSVEHYRHNGIKYLPAVNPFNADTLVRNWKAGEIPGLSPTESYAEPIYYMPMYPAPMFTGRKRAPVPVFRLKHDGSNSITVKLGRLPRGMYAFRVIGAIPVQPSDWTGNPERLVMSCSSNDGPDGAVRTWTRRHRAVDEFYMAGVWYFHAVDDREFAVQVRLEPESQVDLLVPNVDLHNCLAGCPAKIIKTKATIYTTEARNEAQAYYAEHNKLSRSWGSNIALPNEKGLWQGKPLSPEDRRRRDDLLWAIDPPQMMMNMMNDERYGVYDEANPTKEDEEKFGDWEVPYSTRYQRAWDQMRLLENKKLGATYTMDDLLARKPLPDPYPYKDRGWAAYIEGKGFFHPLMAGMINGGPVYKILGHQEVGALCVEYYNRNNLEAARDAAWILCKLAYTLPSSVTDSKRRIQQVTCRAQQCFSFNDPVCRRYTGHELRRLTNIVRAYDLLFDFINGNEELAKEVGRFIPWIKNADDLRTFLDQRLLTWSMKQAVEHRVTSGHGTPEMSILLATVAQDREATRPLMNYLFSATWDYPLPLSGIQDYMVTGTTRDGTTSIGSYFYTLGGSPFLPVADMLNIYIRNGGDEKYDLADPRRYPKPFFGAYFNLDGRVCGQWPLGVGDVGGVMRHGHQLNGQEDAVRLGWQYLKDPKLAYIILHYLGRKGDSDEQWQAIETAAATVKRNPWLANRSRVLAAWGGILEAGTQYDDRRFRRAATVRVGVGWGHSHRDTLDLQLYALGCQMTPDGGQRPGYGRPDCTMTMNHNLVEVDGDGSLRGGNWEGHAWVSTLADMPGSEMLTAQAIPPDNKPEVRFAERTVALLGVDEGKPSAKPADPVLQPDTVYGKDAVLPSSYVFDVYRVAGGKRHVYCFHGCPDDVFTANALNQRKVPLASKADKDDTDAQFLRKFVLDGYQGAGEAPDTIVATWRLAREGFTFDTASGNIDEGKTRTYKCAAPEQLMLGPNYDPAAPRKFIRLHLLGQKGARVIWGRWVSAPYTSNNGLWFTEAHVVHDGTTDRESVFPAIIESYAGDPAVVSTKLLDVADNETDARRAVAVEVKTVNGHTDQLFADARPEKTRRFSDVTVAGEYACVSRDENGLRLASLVGGKTLNVPGVVALEPAASAYSGAITAIDQIARTFMLDRELPGRLIGHSFWNVGNDKHRTSLEVEDIVGSKVTFRKGLELVSTRVVSVDAAAGVVNGKLCSIMMGMTEDNGMKPGMTDGLWASNEALTKWWKCAYTGGTRADGYAYKLSGAPVTAQDFPVNGAIRIWELGPTDNVRLSTFVSLRRDPANAAGFVLSSNVACKVSLLAAAAPQGFAASSDGTTWKRIAAERNGALWTLTLDETALGAGALYLRPVGR